MPVLAVRLVRTLYAHNLMLALLWSVRELGVGRSGVAQGCPLSGMNFELLVGPLISTASEAQPASARVCGLRAGGGGRGTSACSATRCLAAVTSSCSWHGGGRA